MDGPAAAAAAKSLQSCPTVRPHRRQPTRLPRPWDSPGKTAGVGCHVLLQCMKVKVKVKMLSRVRLLATPWTAVYKAPPSMGFSRQEYWSGRHRLPQATVYRAAKSQTRLSTHTTPLTIYCTLQTFSLILKSAGAGPEDRGSLILALHPPRTFPSWAGWTAFLSPVSQSIHVRIRSASISQALLRDNSEGA